MGLSYQRSLLKDSTIQIYKVPIHLPPPKKKHKTWTHSLNDNKCISYRLRNKFSSPEALGNVEYTFIAWSTLTQNGSTCKGHITHLLYWKPSICVHTND